MLSIFPWHEKQWQQLQLAKENNRLPHALLLEGSQGIGINYFSQCLAKNLLCQTQNSPEIACGECKTCYLLQADNHPDLQILEPEEEGKQIKVDQVRKLIEFINLKSQYGQYKIVIISPAENMNRSTANTLLKTLEEPPAQSLIMLLSHRTSLLPVTIRSRCQHIKFNPAYDETTVDWLQNKVNDIKKANELLREAGGAPLAALALNDNDVLEQRNTIISDLELLQHKHCDPIEIAARWNKYNADNVLKSLLQIFNTMTRLKLAVKMDKMVEEGTFSTLQSLANRLEMRKIMQCHDLVLKNYGLATGNISYNMQGLLEDFIIFWQELDNQAGE